MARFQQGRFGDSVALMKEFMRHSSTSPLGYAFLASSYGHLGQAAEAAEALARYLALTNSPIEAFAERMLDDPAHQRSFLEGIALAQGKGAADDAAGAQ